jgi:hypothetical protein
MDEEELDGFSVVNDDYLTDDEFWDVSNDAPTPEDRGPFVDNIDDGTGTGTVSDIDYFGEGEE